MAEFWLCTYVKSNSPVFVNFVTDEHPAKHIREANAIEDQECLEGKFGKRIPNHWILTFAMRITEEEFKAWEGDDDAD